MNNSILPSMGPYTRPSTPGQEFTSVTRPSRAGKSYMSQKEIRLQEECKRLYIENMQLRNRSRQPQEAELLRQLVAAQKTIRSQADTIKKLTTLKPKGYVSCPVRTDNSLRKGWW